MKPFQCKILFVCGNLCPSRSTGPAVRLRELGFRMGRAMSWSGKLFVILSVLGASLCLVPSASAAVVVTVSPTSVALNPGAQQQFTATVTGTTNQIVNWSLSGPGCAGLACGQITGGGLYTAPNAAPSPNSITVTATSTADTSASGSATVSVNPGVVVQISPTSALVNTGGQQQFSATVIGSANTAVTWNISGAGCGGLSCGKITSYGLYTAPTTMPSPPTVKVTATSQADSTKSASATVTIQLVAITISPTSATVAAGGNQQFNTTVTGTTNTAVTWSVSGTGCSGTACGTVSSSGLYTAPTTVPSPPTVSVTATSQADTSKSATATVTIGVPVAVSVAPSTAQVGIGAQQQFSATVTGTNNTAVTWSLSGAGCSGAACGTITATGLYTAPPAVPKNPTVTVTATLQADTTKSGTATVTVVLAPIAVTVSPANATVATGTQQQFTATVTGTANQAVTWSLSGLGCTGVACGTVTSSGLYTAPATIPSPATVAVIATSQADTSKSGDAIVTVIPQVGVVVSPSTAQLNEGAQEQFTATVTGVVNTAVTWSVSGAGCTGSACGTITSGGLYTAPSKLPKPPTITVTAVSQADSSKSGNATVTVVGPVVIKISPTSARVFAGDTKQFTATVTGPTNTAVSWSVSGTGCVGAACGTVDGNGLYTAPPAVPTPATISVTATSQADPSKAASATVTILAAVSVVVTPGNALVPVGGQLQFSAQVSGTSNAAVTWEVSGAGCTPALCGTVSSSGLYVAPATVPSLASVQILAVSAADPQRSGATTVTIVAADAAKLNGVYVFLFRGFDAAGAYTAAGSFTADGNGKLLNGLEDVNRTSGAVSSVAFTGTYSLTPDNRGVFTIKTASGSSTFAFALGATGQWARYIEFDKTGVQGSGIFKARTVSQFSDSTLSGAFVMGVTGARSSSARVGALGSLFFDGSSGSISGNTVDVNDSGNILPTFINFSGAYSVASTGRGTVALSLPGFGSGTVHFAAYVVSSTDVFLVSTDAVATSPILGGELSQQTGALLTAGTLLGPSIFEMTGVTGGFADALIGQMSFDGNSTVTALFDENNGGTVTNGKLTGAYNVSFSGRTTFNLVNSKTHTSTTLIAYLIAGNTALLMDTTTSVWFGALQAQLAKPPFRSSTLSGTFAAGPDLMVASGSPLTSGIISLDGVSAVTGTEDLSSGLSSGLSLAGTYAIGTGPNNGRGQLSLVSPATQSVILWIVSNSEFIALDIDPTNTGPTVWIVSQ